MAHRLTSFLTPARSGLTLPARVQADL
jgi:hypothetical protein